jgi:hypothetical protein
MNFTRENSFMTGLTVGWLFAIMCFGGLVLTENVWSDSTPAKTRDRGNDVVELKREIADLTNRLAALTQKADTAVLASSR